jgi:hypothetical protein
MQLHLFVALALACVLQTTAVPTAAGVSARQVTPPHTAGCCDLDGCFVRVPNLLCFAKKKN